MPVLNVFSNMYDVNRGRSRDIVVLCAVLSKSIDPDYVSQFLVSVAILGSKVQ